MADCSTRTAAFAHHGIRDGTDLITRSHYILAAHGVRSPEPSAEFTELVAMAFRRAFVRAAPVPVVPDPIDAAIDEALDPLAHYLLDAPTVDLRTDVLPRFYRAVATTYCAYLAAGGDPGTVRVWYDDTE